MVSLRSVRNVARARVCERESCGLPVELTCYLYSIQQDTWLNVTKRPTMSESTYFAHRCGALFCEKKQAVCRMETTAEASLRCAPGPAHLSGGGMGSRTRSSSARGSAGGLGHRFAAAARVTLRRVFPEA